MREFLFNSCLLEIKKNILYLLIHPLIHQTFAEHLLYSGCDCEHKCHKNETWSLSLRSVVQEKKDVKRKRDECVSPGLHEKFHLSTSRCTEGNLYFDLVYLFLADCNSLS